MGSEFHLTLSKQERIKIPGAGDEKRVLLENLIRQAGLWEQLSLLDWRALDRAIKSRQLEPQLLRQLSELVKQEITISLHPGKNPGPED
jgi:hypothetical protein